jgi:polyphenol oxidase
MITHSATHSESLFSMRGGALFRVARWLDSLTLLCVLIRQTAANGVVLYSSPLLKAIGVKHGFSTRIGGISPIPFDSLNLGNLPGAHRDADQNLTENLRRLEQATEMSDRRRLWVHQIHGNRVAVASDLTFECGTQADALVSDDPTVYLLVRVADCVPILLASPDGRVVAAVHAGWRGVIAGVVTQTVKVITDLAHIRSGEITAAIGPCISHDFFEVGPEVIAEFVGLFGAGYNRAERHVDLPGGVARQLLDAGVFIERIDRTDRCTARDRDEFFSHRRDQGVTGRMAAVIAPANS